jgi:CBS domain containing-hemolysin-like protein
MTDPDPSSRQEPARGGGLIGLFHRFRKTAPEAEAQPGDAEANAANGELVNQARAFQDLRIEDVMKPRADIVAIEKHCPFSELVARFVEAEHSRMPVYRDTLDEPTGVVHVKDVFKLLARKTGRPKPEDQVLMGRRHLVRPILYVPASMRAAELMALMRARQTHMALVIDEFGGTDGLVTLEDLLERLVGAIADEHDEESDQAFAPIVADDQGWIADGRAPLEDLEAAVGPGADLAPEEVDEEIDTVAGMVTTLAGRVPQRGERIEHPGGFIIDVLAADPRRVKRVRLRRVPATTPPPRA